MGPLCDIRHAGYTNGYHSNYEYKQKIKWQECLRIIVSFQNPIICSIIISMNILKSLFGFAP